MGGVLAKLKAKAEVVHVPVPLWAELQHFRALWRNLAIRQNDRAQGLFRKRYLELAAVLGPMVDPNLQPRAPTEVNGEELWKVVAALPETFDSVAADVFPKIVACLFEPSQPALGSEQAKEATAKAFDQTKFHSTTGYVELFTKTLGKYALLWKAGNHYAPLTSVVNASMIGKSRMLNEVPGMGVFCFLICTRAVADGNCRPPRTPFVADFLANELTGNRTEAEFQTTCETLFVRILGKLADWLQTQERKTTGGADDRLKHLTVQWFEHTQSGTFWTEDLCKPTQNAEETWAGAEQRVQAQLERLLHRQLDQGNLHVLFVVDEAKAMVTVKTFLPFRRATQIFPKTQSSLNSFCVVTDTTSTVANFNPAEHAGPSGTTSPAGMHTFAPFTLVKSLDAWWLAAKELNCYPAADEAAILERIRAALVDGKVQTGSPCRRLEDVLTMSLLKRFEVMSCSGRPAFFGFQQFNKDTSGGDPRALQIRLIQSKLLRAPVGQVKAKQVEVSLEAAVAVLGSLVSIEISAGSELAAVLASGHLRLVGAISVDRHLVYTLEIPEPVMALAAHDLLMSGVLTWAEIMDKFYQAELSNSTMIGYRGEVASQILFLMTWQKCLANRFPHADSKWDFPAVPVLDFLEALFGPLELKPATRAKLGRGFIRVYQIVKIFAEPSNALLYQAFIRGCGMHCKEAEGHRPRFSHFLPRPLSNTKETQDHCQPGNFEGWTGTSGACHESRYSRSQFSDQTPATVPITAQEGVAVATTVRPEQ